MDDNESRTGQAVPPAEVQPAHVAFVDFKRWRALPPSALYLARDDQLYVRAHALVAGLTLQVVARLMQPDGQVTPQLLELAPSSAGAESRAVMGLAEGYLLSAGVRVLAGAPVVGDCFVELGLVRPDQGGVTVTQVLVADYLSTERALGWPGGPQHSALDGAGRLVSLLGTDPAAGAEVSEAVPANTRWLLRSFRVQLVTAAAVANRRVHLVIDDGATILMDLAAADVQAATLTRNYNAAPDGYARATQDNEIYLPLPGPVLLFAGARVRTLTTAIQAADNFGAPQMLVERWIEP